MLSFTEILEKCFEIDPDIPMIRTRNYDYYSTYNGGSVIIFRHWYHELFKNGRPKKLRKRK